VLVRNGQIDTKALARESLTKEELVEVVHKQGFESVDQVRLCQLEPTARFIWRRSSLRRPTSDTRSCSIAWTH